MSRHEDHESGWFVTLVLGILALAVVYTQCGV